MIKKYMLSLALLLGTIMVVGCGNGNPTTQSYAIGAEWNTDSTADRDIAGDSSDALETENVSEDELTAMNYYVHICGAVNSPGVYCLPAGSRLYEAINLAGGFTPEAGADCCNLADEIQDGMQYRIPTAEEAAMQNLQVGTTGNRYDSSYDEEGRLDINMASVSELMLLPGIGQTRAEAIVTYREEHGAFTQAEDIMLVSGIKSNLYSQIEDYITVR